MAAITKSVEIHSAREFRGSGLKRSLQWPFRMRVLTSSPSLRIRGALTKARLSVRSWFGLLTLVRINVSPERTLLTLA